MIDPIILEKGHNTTGLYAFLSSMFLVRSDSVNKILNDDGEDIRISYVQEFLKEEIIGRFQLNKSMPIQCVDRFRILLFNFGWRKNQRHSLDRLLGESDPSDIYRFLFIEGMKNRLLFERVEPKENKVDTVSLDAIEIGAQDLVFSDGDRPIINLSSSIKRWIHKNIVEEDTLEYSYRFKELPYLIPIFIDPDINNTEENDRVPIDIKESIGFQSLNDPVQKIFTWDIQSIILYNSESNEYLSLVRDDSDSWYRISEANLPANEKIDMSDPKIVNQIARQVRAVFYKIK